MIKDDINCQNEIYIKNNARIRYKYYSVHYFKKLFLLYVL